MELRSIAKHKALKIKKALKKECFFFLYSQKGVGDFVCVLPFAVLTVEDALGEVA